MYTANDMKEALNKCYCDGIDDWLQDEILPRFLSGMDVSSVTVKAEELGNKGWDALSWRRSMKQRGFVVNGFPETQYQISL